MCSCEVSLSCRNRVLRFICRVWSYHVDQVHTIRRVHLVDILMDAILNHVIAHNVSQHSCFIVIWSCLWRRFYYVMFEIFALLCQTDKHTHTHTHHMLGRSYIFPPLFYFIIYGFYHSLYKFRLCTFFHSLLLCDRGSIILDDRKVNVITIIKKFTCKDFQIQNENTSIISRTFVIHLVLKVEIRNTKTWSSSPNNGGGGAWKTFCLIYKLKMIIFSWNKTTLLYSLKICINNKKGWETLINNFKN